MNSRTLMLIALCIARSARADEGGIPIYTVTTITQPGRYVVTRDFSGASPITINANDVTLDINGRTVTATSGNAVTIVDGRTNITVRNGTLVGGNVSYVTSTVAAKVRVENITLRSGYVDIGNLISRADVIGCRIESAGYGVRLFGTGGWVGHVADNDIRTTTTYGIYLYDAGSVVVRNNTIKDYGSGSFWAGISIQGSSSAGAGVLVEANTLVSDETFVTNIWGIWLGSNAGSCVVRDNVIVRAGDNGIKVSSSGNVISGNLVSGSTSHGIDVAGDNNLVEGNQVRGNTGCGINFTGTTHVYRDNMLRGNTGGAVCGAASTDGGGNFS